MMTFLTAIHVTTVVLLVITVLLQSGKGAEISASFGGSSQTVFGSSGGANFFQKLTYGLAAVFMTTSLVLTILPGRVKRSVFEGYTAPSTSIPVGNTAAGLPTTTVPGTSNAAPVGATSGTTASTAAGSTAGATTGKATTTTPTTEAKSTQNAPAASEKKK
jgi:preprotein translocase subunit SecG